MSIKTAVINKEKSQQKSDNINKDKAVDPDNKKQQGVKKKLKEEDPDDSSDENANIGADVFKKDDVDQEVNKDTEKYKQKKKTKDELFKKDQENFFEEMKTIIGVKKSNSSFLLKDVEKNKQIEMINFLLEGMKKYYDSNMSRGISGKDTKTLLAIIRKLCDHHGFDLIKKEVKIPSERWFQYYIVIRD